MTKQVDKKEVECNVGRLAYMSYKHGYLSSKVDEMVSRQGKVVLPQTNIKKFYQMLDKKKDHRES